MKGHGKKKFTLRGTTFFAFVVLLYLVLSIIQPEAALSGLQKGGRILGRVAPILLVVIFFTGLLNYLIRPAWIKRHLGGESGLRGWFWSVAAGVISHGPMYAWYPLFEDLRKHGMHDGLITTFFFARAIKLPLLPLMVDYFGWQFTLVLSFYILCGSVVQGALHQWLNKVLKSKT